MSETDLSTHTEKFLFNDHIFDEDQVEEEELLEDLPPPPPTFSEAELAAAKQQAFEEGKQKGIEEAKAARAQQIAGVLDVLSQNFHTLFEAEAAREKQYEVEAVKLALTSFQKLLPHYSETVGFEELQATMEEILITQQDQDKIDIHVSSDVREGIEAFLEKLATSGIKLRFEVHGDYALDQNSFRMNWSDGGAVRDSEALAQKIEAEMIQILAGTVTTGHDDGEELNKNEPHIEDKPLPEDEKNQAPEDSAPIVEKTDE